MKKPHKSRNSEPNEQSPWNIFEIFSCSWAPENFSHSWGLRTDISPKTVVGCPWIERVGRPRFIQTNLTDPDFSRNFHELNSPSLVCLMNSSTFDLGLILATTLHRRHDFCTLLCRCCTTATWNCLISLFMKDVNTTKRFYFYVYFF